MKSKMMWANLGVESIKRTRNFYEKLGFQLNGTPSEDLVSFIFAENKFIIHFFKAQRLKESIEGELANLNQGNEVLFSLSVDTKTEYDEWVNEITHAGGTIFFDSNTDRKKLYDEHGFYVCVFADPDGHKFNLLFNENK